MTKKRSEIKMGQNGPPTNGCLRTPEAKQGEVIGLRMASKSHREIASLTGLARETVRKILNQHEVRIYLSESNTVLVEKAPLVAQKLVEIALRGRGDRQACTDILRGIHVLTPNQKVPIEENGDDVFFEGKTYHEVAFYSHFLKFPNPEELEEFKKVHHEGEELNLFDDREPGQPNPSRRRR